MLTTIDNLSKLITMVSIISADYNDWCFQLTSMTYDAVLLVMSLAIIIVLFNLIYFKNNANSMS